MGKPVKSLRDFIYLWLLSKNTANPVSVFKKLFYDQTKDRILSQSFFWVSKKPRNKQGFIFWVSSLQSFATTKPRNTIIALSLVCPQVLALIASQD
jgi:hypothetical protein